jgi:type II secretory pathway pseudopilin PulG
MVLLVSKLRSSRRRGAHERGSVGFDRFRRSEAGFVLVEVMTTSLVVALIGVAVLLGLEGASHGSGANKARSVAAALAQQDQERMRAFKATDLSNYHETRTVNVAGVGYAIESNANWVSDSSGALSCTNGSQQANYIKISSTVRWERMRQLKPVTVESLVAPPPGSFNANQGNLAVQINDQASNPVAGLPVNLGPPASVTNTTGSQGCAVFGAVDARSYDVSWSRSGWVDPAGDNAVTKPASVVASTTTMVTFLYAEAGRITVSFDTKVGNNPPQVARAQTVSLGHGGIPGDGIRTFDAIGGPQSQIDATGLFPFTSAYGVYAGGCQANDPTRYDGQYSSHFVTVAPRGSHSATVRMPALNIAVTRGGVPLQNAHVVVRAADSGCSAAYTSLSTNAQGALQNPGFPFGNYNVCADDGTRRASQSSVQNRNPAGSATVPLAIPTTGSSGVCT